MRLGTCQTGACALARTGVAWQPSCRLSGTPADGNRVNGVLRDVIHDGAFGDMRCAADVDEADAPLSDEPTNEPGRRAKRFGCLVTGEKPLKQLCINGHRYRPP